MRAYTHGGWVHRLVSTTFFTREKLSQIVRGALLTGFELRVRLNLEVDALPTEPPPSPRLKNNENSDNHTHTDPSRLTGRQAPKEPKEHTH